MTYMVTLGASSDKIVSQSSQMLSALSSAVVVGNFTKTLQDSNIASFASVQAVSVTTQAISFVVLHTPGPTVAPTRNPTTFRPTHTPTISPTNAPVAMASLSSTGNTGLPQWEWIVIIVGIVVTVLLLAGVGFWWMRRRHTQQSKVTAMDVSNQQTLTIVPLDASLVMTQHHSPQQSNKVTPIELYTQTEPAAVPLSSEKLQSPVVAVEVIELRAGDATDKHNGTDNNTTTAVSPAVGIPEASRTLVSAERQTLHATAVNDEREDVDIMDSGNVFEEDNPELFLVSESDSEKGGFVSKPVDQFLDSDLSGLPSLDDLFALSGSEDDNVQLLQPAVEEFRQLADRVDQQQIILDNVELNNDDINIEDEYALSEFSDMSLYGLSD